MQNKKEFYMKENKVSIGKILGDRIASITDKSLIVYEP